MHRSYESSMETITLKVEGGLCLLQFFIPPSPFIVSVPLCRFNLCQTCFTPFVSQDWCYWLSLLLSPPLSSSSPPSYPWVSPSWHIPSDRDAVWQKINNSLLLRYGDKTVIILMLCLCGLSFSLVIVCQGCPLLISRLLE